jgi:hypothetical protein
LGGPCCIQLIRTPHESALFAYWLVEPGLGERPDTL